LVRRRLSDGLWDAISPYGYSGLVMSSAGDPGFLSQAFVAAETVLREEGCVSWFMRLHPILNAEWQRGRGELVESGRTVSIDLKKTRAAHWSETRSGHRSDIKRARSAGVTVDLDPEFDLLDEFVTLYLDTMRSVGAETYYLFDSAYFNRLVHLLGKELQLYVARVHDVVVGASFFTISTSSGLLQYHLSASSDAHRNLQPSKIIIDCAREWGRENGFDRLHLGGGIGGKDDTLLYFKEGFARSTHVYRTCGTVINRPEYDRLTREVGIDPSWRSDFFPAYRRSSVLDIDQGEKARQ